MLSASARATSTTAKSAVSATRCFVATTPAVHAEQTTSPVSREREGPAHSVVPSAKRTGLVHSHRVGTGGRSSFSGQVVTVFGASGWLGLHAVNRIAKDGTQIVIPYRGDPYNVREQKVVGDLGQILFFPFHLRDEESIRKAVKYSNVVVNMIGSFYESSNFSFDGVHVEGAARVARIAREMGVSRLVHVSALNASPDPQATYIRGGSKFLRSKHAGELAVRAEFPSATIVRPAGVFGFGDQWMRGFLARTRKVPFGCLELHAGGEETFKMPVYKNDVAAGIARIVNDPTWDGQTLEFAGPHCLNVREIGQLINVLQGVDHYRVTRGYSPYTTAMTSLNTLIGNVRKKKMGWNWELLETIEATNDRLSGVPTLHDVLGTSALHSFELLCREWTIERSIDWVPRHAFHDRPTPTLNHYPLMYTDDVDTDKPTFDAFDTLASPFK